MSDYVLLFVARMPPASPAEGVRAWGAAVLEPWLEALDGFEDHSCGMVMGGELLEELSVESPATLEKLRQRVESGQVEMVAYPFYGPFMDDYSTRDGMGQVQIHVAALLRLLGARPRGLSLPWGAFGPQVPSVAERCGLDWITGTFCEGIGSVEYAGVSVRALGYHETSWDAEKLPGATHILQYDLCEPGWETRDSSVYAALFQRLGHFVGPGTAVAAAVPAARTIVVPARPAAQYRRDWHAADVLYQRIVATSHLVERLERGASLHEASGPEPIDVTQAQRYLWRAQAGDVFREGSLGGVRNPMQRHRAWRDVLRAERVALTSLHAARRPSAALMDIDGDGVDEIVLRSASASARIVPAARGGVASLSVGDSAHQLCAIPRRVPGPGDEPGGSTGDHMREDIEPRWSFRDRFLQQGASLTRFEGGLLEEPATGFDGPWQVLSAERSGSGARCQLARSGEIHEQDGSWPVEVRKRYTLRGSELELRYEVANAGLEVLRTRILIPMDLSMGPNPDAFELRCKGKRASVDTIAEWASVKQLQVVGAHGEANIQVDGPVRVWRYPIWGTSRVDGKQKRVLQGVALGIVWLVQLWVRENASLTLRLSYRPT